MFTKTEHILVHEQVSSNKLSPAQNMFSDHNEIKLDTNKRKM